MSQFPFLDREVRIPASCPAEPLCVGIGADRVVAPADGVTALLALFHDYFPSAFAIAS